MYRVRQIVRPLVKQSLRSLPKAVNRQMSIISRSGQGITQRPLISFKSSLAPMGARFMSNIVTENLDSLGESITTAVVLSWSKEAGEVVKEDDVVATVETDKVTMDIRAKRAGVFVKALVPSQGEVSVGAPLYSIDLSATSSPPVHSETTADKAADKPPVSASTPSASASSAEEVTVSVPVMGESITTGVLASWLKQAGDSVKADEVVASIDTDKVSVEVRSPAEGVIKKVFFNNGDEVNVGAPLFSLSPQTVAASSTSASTSAEKKSEKVVSPSPSSDTTNSNKKSEVEKVEKKKETKSTTSSPSTTTSSTSSTSSRGETRVKMTRMRQRIAARLKESQNTAAMLTTFQEVDMTNLIALRNLYKEDFEKSHGVKLGFMSAFVSAATSALQAIPAVNAVIDDATQEVVYRHFCDISVAVASPTGLVVPVLRNTEKMSFAEVEKQIAAYGNKAKEGTLSLEDMTGGTFTISNGGVFGSLFGTPIINPPQSAILGMHATKMRAVVTKEGKVEARPMMYLALTYDHRLIDGREAVTFLKHIANKIEDPQRMLLSV